MLNTADSIAPSLMHSCVWHENIISKRNKLTLFPFCKILKDPNTHFLYHWSFVFQEEVQVPNFNFLQNNHTKGLCTLRTNSSLQCRSSSQTGYWIISVSHLINMEPSELLCWRREWADCFWARRLYSNLNMFFSTNLWKLHSSSQW